jgi:hypothetical protein
MTSKTTSKGRSQLVYKSIVQVTWKPKIFRETTLKQGQEINFVWIRQKLSLKFKKNLKKQKKTAILTIGLTVQKLFQFENSTPAKLGCSA